MSSAYRDLYWQSQDRLRLFARVYDHPDPDAKTVLCLHGLRRNSRDFAEFAPHLQARYRVIAPDLRGRGLSARDSHATNYQPNTYVRDILKLLNTMGTPRVAIVGSALGGLLGMMLAQAQPALVSALILNDIGPHVEESGKARILQHIAHRPQPKDWVEATQRLKDIYGDAWYDLPAERWPQLARRLYREDAYGRIVLDCDPVVSEMTRQHPAASTDLWPIWDSLADLPVLVIRGARSDILSEATCIRMKREKPDLEQLTLENRGHFPLLDEGPLVAAVDDFLARNL